MWGRLKTWLRAFRKGLHLGAAALYSVNIRQLQQKPFMMKKSLSVLAAALVPAACGGSGADKTGNAGTVFNMLGKNGRIGAEGFDDTDVQGVSCYIPYAEKGGLKESVNLEEDTGDASVPCVQTAQPIRCNEAAAVGAQVFGSCLIGQAARS